MGSVKLTDLEERKGREIIFFYSRNRITIPAVEFSTEKKRKEKNIR